MVTSTRQKTFSRMRRDYGPVVIAIVSYRNADDVCACLAALSHATETNFLISICENGGGSAYQTLVRTLEGLIDFDEADPQILDLRVVEASVGRLRPGGQSVRIYRAEHNLGYAGGINVSIQQASIVEAWSALWILNPDTEADPNALTALIARAREGDYGIVSSRLVSKSTQRIQAYGSRWRPLIGRGFNIGKNAQRDAVPDIDLTEREMNYVSGASLFATRDYVESVGLIDERYFLYCEEVDWCFRGGSHRFGYAHGALVYHSHGTTIGSSWNWKERSSLSVYLGERNKLLLTRRFYPTLYPLVVVAALLMILQYLGRGAVKNFFVALSGWSAGLRGEEGPPRRPFPELATEEAL
jgi:N-acetylglucosaminyl-diphospho-decaprenol L-rhamnosyltransferase